MNFAPNRGRAADLLALVDEAISDGVDVTLDTYPYFPGATTLAALLPSRLAESGDLLGTIAALDEHGREAVRVELEEIGCDGFHGERADWDAIQISGTADPRLADLVGHTIAAIAASSGRRAVDVVLDTIIADRGATGILMHIGDEDNVRAIMAPSSAQRWQRRHPHRCEAASSGPRYLPPLPRTLRARARGAHPQKKPCGNLSGTPAARLGLDRGGPPLAG